MSNKKADSLIIEGMGTYAGGEFECVDISGKGTITGDLSCKALNISGMAAIEGNIVCGQVKITGSCKLEKDIEADKIKVSGSLKHLGNMKADSLEITGAARIKQCLNSTRITSSGMLNVEGDINSEEIKSEGMINCSGLMNCETLELSFSGGCRLNEVGGTYIKILEGRMSFSRLLEFFVPGISRLTANVIEGDEIFLENCDVKVVRGRNVKLGKNCRIHTVEYSGDFEADPQSEVEILNKLD